MIEYNGSEDGRDIPQKWRRKKANGGSKMKKKESKRRKQVGEEMTQSEGVGFKLVRRLQKKACGN